MAEADLVPRRPLQLGVATGADVEWMIPTDPVRVRGADLGEVARRVSAVRRDDPDAEVVVDIEFVIADDARSARALAPTDHDFPDGPTVLYVGTPAGLAGLIADLHAIGIADGAVLIPRAAGGADMLRDAVIPVLSTMARLAVTSGEERTA